MLEFVENLSDYDGLGTEGLIPNNKVFAKSAYAPLTHPNNQS